MPRIHTITTDTVITDNDMILGTDGAVGANNATKNFSFGVFKNYLLTEPTITGNLTVSGGEIILDNNRYLQGKLTNGTAIDLIGVKNNNIVTISDDAQEVHIGPLSGNTTTQLNGSLILVGAGVFNGAITVAGNTTLGNALTDTVTVAGDATFNRDVTITRNLTVNGTINLGDADTDNIIFGADVDSHILPDDDATFNLGSSSKKWDTLFASRVELSSHAAVGGNLTVTGTTTLNGNSTFNAPITVGANGTGHAITINSASSGRALTYDPTDDTDGMSKLMFGENMKAQFGTNTADLAIYNDGTDSFIDAGTEAGKLYIRNKGVNRDIVFQAYAGMADDTPETYFLLDGSLAEDGSGSQTVNYTRWPEFASIAMGDVSVNGVEGAVLNNVNGHFAISHHIGTGTSEKNINFYNYSPDGDIEFFTNGTNPASYLRLDGGQEKIFINQDVNPYAIKGATGQPGYLELKADNGANNSDHWKLSAEADNVFEIQTRDGGSYAPVVELVASNKMAYFKGNVDVDGNLTASNFSGSSSGTNTGDQDLSSYAPLASPTFTGTVTTGANLIVLAGQDTAAQVELKADAGDNNDDHWKLSAETNARFKILTRDGGSYNSVVDFIASNKSSLFKGDIHVSGVIENQHFKIPNAIGTEGQVLKVPASGNTLEWGAADSIPHIREGANFGGSLLIGHTTTGTLNSALSNTALGIGVLASITEGDSNVAIGNAAADALTEGDYNVAIGVNALGAITTQGGNVAIGYGAGDTLTDLSHGSNNVFIGSNAGGAIASGQGKAVFVGGNAGANNVKGQTTGIGYNALSKNEGSGNTALGYGAGKNNMAGSGNTYIGTSAGEWAENSTTSDNTLVGAFSGKSTSFEGINNTTLGADAGYFMEECNNNVLIGRHAGRAIKNDSSNVIIGKDAAADNEHVGDQNVAIGTNALNNINAGTAGIDTRNVVIGYSSGSTIVEGTQNTLLGALTQPSGANTSNEIVIGYDVDGLGANKAVIGNASTTNIAPGGNNTASLGDDTRGFKELILSSPDGTKYRIKVSNAGALSATAV